MVIAAAVTAVKAVTAVTASFSLMVGAAAGKSATAKQVNACHSCQTMNWKWWLHVTDQRRPAAIALHG